jgi:flagellar protein FliO/FliZ
VDTLFLGLRVVISLAAVLGVIWFLQRRLTKRGGRGRAAQKPITVVSRQGLGNKASVAVLDIDGRRFVVGVTEHAINVLHSSETPAAIDAEFSRVLAEAEPVESVVMDESNAAATPVADSLPGGILAGSILSSQTWRQALAGLRSAR